MKQQLIGMLSLQDEMNCKVHAQWEQQGFAWYRAIWTECAELLEHYGWKWWKKCEPDLPQVQLEVVDIWHFGMSLQLQTCGNDKDKVATDLLAGLTVPESAPDLRVAIERLAAQAVAEHRFDVGCFAQVMGACGLSFAALHRQYIGKNVLNFFRQDHGYQQGTYLKVWNEREDNQHLVEVLDELALEPNTPGALRELVYQALAARYPN